MKVAFIGMGTMGVGMAMNILKAGHELTVHNRTRVKEEALADAGAQRAASPREAAAKAEIIVICVSDTPDVEEIILGDEGVIQGASQGAVVVDNSTISPRATRRMAATTRSPTTIARTSRPLLSATNFCSSTLCSVLWNVSMIASAIFCESARMTPTP